VEADDQEDASRMAQILSNTFSSYSTLANHAILGSVMATYSGDTPITSTSPSENRTLAIVLGICIPVIFLAIVTPLAVYFIRKRKTKKAGSEHSEKSTVLDAPHTSDDCHT
jgi:H+/gluconate symporter-like permease